MVIEAAARLTLSFYPRRFLLLVSSILAALIMTLTSGCGGGSHPAEKNTLPILVAGITVSGAGNVTNLVKLSSLQMQAVVTPTMANPAMATNPAVVWSVVPGTGTATISSTGLLTGTGLGTVTVKATATDGSGVFGTDDITIVNPPAVPVTPKLDPPDITSTQIHSGYENGRTVTITAASGSTIYYTTDGTAPTMSSSLYSGPFDLKGNFYTPTVKAIAVKSGSTTSDPASVTLPQMYYAVYSGTFNGPALFISYDGGATFPYQETFNSAAPYIKAVCALGSQVYASVKDDPATGNNKSLWGSSDWGQTWSLIDGSHQYNAVTSDGSSVWAASDKIIVNEMTNQSIDASSWVSNRINGIAVVGSNVWASTDSDGVGVYNLNSQSWTTVPAVSLPHNREYGVVADSSAAYIGTDNGLYVVTNTGTVTTYSIDPSNTGNIVNSLALDGSTLYLGSNNGLYKTLTSSINVSGPISDPMTKVSASQGVIYILTSNFLGLAYSRDGGQNWLLGQSSGSFDRMAYGDYSLLSVFAGP